MKIRKGHIVVLEIRESATYAIGSGRGTECNTVWTLARVSSASRDGSIIRKAVRVDWRWPRDPKDCGWKVHFIPDAAQGAASRLFSSVETALKSGKWDAYRFASAEALTSAIKSA